jgi:hypothetical protein
MSTARIVICRNADDGPGPLRSGMERGYFCRICHNELQVSPGGRSAIAEGGYAMCNPCGFTMEHRLRHAGVNVERKLSDAAARTLLEMIDRRHKK